MSETDTLEPDVIHSRIEDRVWMTLARRISRFPLAGIADTKRQVNYITLPAPDALAEDSRLFLEKMRSPVGQPRLTMLFQRGLQTDGELEAGFGAALARLPGPRRRAAPPPERAPTAGGPGDRAFDTMPVRRR